VKARRFRADLFYRIHVIPIAVPALRARREDVPLLANHFLEQYGARYGRPNLQLTRAAIERLTTYAWPGNVRELESAVTRAVTLSSGTIIDASDLSLASSEEPPASLLCDSERSIIQQTLELHRWHKDEAARALGISRTTLWRKVRSYGLTPARHAADSSH
jgi:DNA-binding NtrC family response regulator